MSQQKSEIPIIVGDSIYLKELTEADVDINYVNWMNDYDVVKFTESKNVIHTLTSIRTFVENCTTSESDILFGIFWKENDKHIGNIKLGSINFIHKHADIGLIIGLKEYWGQHVASNAISLVTAYAFNNLDMHKVYAGIYACNTGSKNAFVNAGYHLAYIKKEEVFFHNDWIDCIFMEKFNPK